MVMLGCWSPILCTIQVITTLYRPPTSFILLGGRWSRGRVNLACRVVCEMIQADYVSLDKLNKDILELVEKEGSDSPFWGSSGLFKPFSSLTHKSRTKASHFHHHHGDDRDHRVQVTTIVRCTYSRGREACLHIVVVGVSAKEQNLSTILRDRLTDAVIHVILIIVHIGDGSCRGGRIVIVRGR